MFRFVRLTDGETGLREPRRAYGGFVNVSGICVVWHVAPLQAKAIFSDANLKGGRMAERGW